ncbi:MAG: gliding motility-associated C-terminal domain-containing protein [Bacteroidia bacterium]|nr:gliding motility-associated C-terminal domain-containing protein [Bacteroidia bacterium]
MRKTLSFNIWMNKTLHKHTGNHFTGRIGLLLLVIFLGLNGLRAQLTVPDYTACPNQPLVVCGTWNNVSNITYTLNPGGTIQLSNPCFSITTPTVTTVYTMCAVGSSLGLPTNSCDAFTVYINVPPPLVINHQGDYCHGDNAVLTAPVGGVSYTVAGPPGVANMVSPSNVITIPNLSSVPYTGTYTVSTILNGCLSTGVTQINVAPNHQIAVSSPSSVCLGGVVNLTAAMPTATAYTWTGPLNYYVTTPGFPPAQVTCSSVNTGGVYSVFADIVFNSITCPRTATTSISVVQTSPINASAAPSKTVCEGTNVNLTAAVSGQAQGFTWLGPQGYSSSLQNPVLSAIIPNMAGSYSVTALFFNSSITCTTSAVVDVVVVGISQPLVSSTSDICQGNTATLSVNASNPSSTPTYSWSGPNNFSAGNVSFISIPQIQPNQAGIYFVYAMFNNNNTTQLVCTTSKSVQINVVTINSISVIPPGQVCQPNNANLQANAIGASSYVWVGPNGFGPVPSANAIVYYPTPAASGIYTVTAFFTSGVTCSNTAVVSLTVNPLLNFTLSPYQVICYNNPLIINGPSGGTSYSWTSSSGYASNTQNVNVPSAQPNLSGTYTLNVALGPCVTTGTSLVEVLTPIQFTLTPNSRTICRGDTVILEGGVTGGSQNYGYTWNPSIYLGSSNGSVQVGVPLGTTIYNLIAWDNAQGCSSYSVVHSFSVIVNQPPVPNLQLDKSEGCAPLCLLYDTQSQDSTEIATFNFGGLDVFQSDSAFYKCLDVPGSYTLEITSLGKNGCTGVYTYPYPLVVHPNPGTSIFWEPESPTVTDNITLNTTNDVNPVMYTWLIANQALSGYDTTNQVTPMVNYDVAGSYPVYVITKTDKDCMDTVSRVIKVRDDYNVYIPNTFTPNNDGLNDVFMVVGTGFKEEGFVMEITDRWGTLVYTTNDVTKGWDGTVDGKIGNDGTYIYKIKAVGANNEGRKEYVGYVNIIK